MILQSSEVAKDGLCRHNYLLDILKVFFAIEIAYSHFHQGGDLVFQSLYSFVDFFFIISGFYLARSFFSGRYSTVKDYTLHRVGRLMPAYLVAFTCLFIFRLIVLAPPNTIGQFAAEVVNRLPELLLVQNLGIFDGGINYPLWYVCVLVFVSHVIFALLKHDESLTLNVIGPLTIVLTGTYLFNIAGTHEVMKFSVEALFFYEPLLRGFCFVFIGACCYRPTILVLEYINKLKHASLATSLVCAACIVALWRFDMPSVYLAFLILITFSSSSKMVLNRLFASNESFTPVFSRVMVELSLHIYFNQALVIYSFNSCPGVWADMSHTALLLVFLFILLLVCVFTIAASRAVSSKLVPMLKSCVSKG